MAYTLSKLLHDGLSEIRLLRYGEATGGSTTSLTDTGRPSTEDAQSFIGGTLIVRRDSGGASAAPEGEFSRITNYASNVFTLADALSAAIASGDRYAASSNQFNHEELIELANAALQRFDLAVLDTSLTAAANQTEYTLPVGLKQEDLLKIEYQGRTTDANDNNWITLRNFDTTFTTAGSTATLTLPQLPVDRTIRITYIGRHPEVNAYSDVIAEVIHPELAKFSFVERLTNRFIEQTKNSARPFAIGYDKAKDNFENAKREHPINIQKRLPKHTVLYSAHSVRQGGPDLVSL